MSDDDSACWNTCLVCKATNNDTEKQFAHEKAHDGANKKATAEAAACAYYQKEYEYIEYYMFLYRLHYTNEYTTLSQMYKEEYYNSILKKFSKASHKDICSYHQESISWLK
jgi:hypothetical protein